MKVDGAILAGVLLDAGSDARRFEELGFDGVLSFEGQHDPFVPLLLAAGTTQRVRLTTAVAIAFARNPMVCAAIANDLHLVSKGRFVLGLGTQIRPHIERRFSETWSKPNSRMREYVRALRAIWDCWNAGAPLDFRGEFYTHTLMTPFFSPGANPFGPPPIQLAGFGPAMIEIAGEVADGWIVHPLHSRRYVEEIGIPALNRGLAKSSRDRAGFEISCQTIVMIGSNDAEIARARHKAKAQIAFYSSTPGYRGMLELHGWEALQPELRSMTKAGRWAEMPGLITDEMLDVIGVSGTPREAGRRIAERNAFAERVSLVTYNETDDDAIADLVRAIQGN